MITDVEGCALAPDSVLLSRFLVEIKAKDGVNLLAAGESDRRIGIVSHPNGGKTPQVQRSSLGGSRMNP